MAAGFDAFAPEVISRFMREYVKQLNLSMEEFIALGQSDPGHPDAAFTMATLAMRASHFVNGVSLLHGVVSRRLFQPLFPRWPEEEVPVSYVTNGVHVPSWDSKWTDTLWTQAVGKERWLGSLESLAKAIQGFPDRELWRVRCQGRAALVTHARQRLVYQSRVLGIDVGSAEDIQGVLDPDILTLGLPGGLRPTNGPPCCSMIRSGSSSCSQIRSIRSSSSSPEKRIPRTSKENGLSRSLSALRAGLECGSE